MASFLVKMSSEERVMTVFFMAWTEVLDEQGNIAFQWNGRNVLAEKAFERLGKQLERSQKNGTRVYVVIKGRLGRDVNWESSVLKHVGQSVRQVFTRWYTQAVQAQAALVRQRVRRPAFDLPEGEDT